MAWMRRAAAAAAMVLGMAAAVARAQLAVPADAVPDAAEAARFGAAIEKAFREGDAKAILSRIDFRKLADAALAGVPGDPASRSEFAADFAKGAAPSYEFGLRGFASFRFLRAIATNGQQVAVFRILLPTGGMNYHRYVLRRGADGAEVADGHALASGEWFSESIRRLFVMSEARRDPAFASRLAGPARDIARNVDAFEKAVALAQKGKPVEFLDACRALPAGCREDRVLLLLRIVAGLDAEPYELGLALKDWARLYPGDPVPELLAFEKLSKRGEHDRAASALAKLDAALGGDPHLRALQAAQLARVGEISKARALAEAAMRDEPNLPSVHDAGIEVALARRDYASVARLVDAAAKAFGKDPLPIVTEEPQFLGFRSSPEGRAWIQAQRRR